MKDRDLRVKLARLDERQKSERRARKSADRTEERERRTEVQALRASILASSDAVEKGRITYEQKQTEYDRHHNGLIEETKLTVAKLVTMEKFESVLRRVSELENKEIAGGGRNAGLTLGWKLVIGFLGFISLVLGIVLAVKGLS
jgi:hypothetical protein